MSSRQGFPDSGCTSKVCVHSLRWGLAQTIFGLVVAALMTACIGGSNDENTPEYQASLAAKQSYEALYVEGQPEAFLHNRVYYGDMPDDFQQQLLDDYRNHLRQVERTHQGVKAVDVVRAQMDTTLSCMQVFLSLSYGDGRREEVVVPMVVDADGHWRLQ